MTLKSALILSALIAVQAAAGGPARAQQPAGPPPTMAPPASPAPPPAVPEKMPFDIPYGTTIGLDRAKQLIAAAEAEAKKHDWRMFVCVTDTHGDLVALDRMDGAMLASATVAPGKARTAARWRRDTRVFFKLFEAGKTYLGTLDPLLSAAPGGIPLVEDGKLIGAMGVSGGTGDQDEIVAKAGVAALK